MLEPGEVFTLGEERAGLSTGWSVVHELSRQSHFVFASEADAQLLALSGANIKFPCQHLIGQVG